MKLLLKDLINSALLSMGIEASDKIQIDYTRDRAHGDFSCNVAMLLAKSMKRKPSELASDIVSQVSQHPAIANIEVAGVGFINISLAPEAFHSLLVDIIETKSEFGRSRMGAGRKVHIEFVSSNPTGPLHVGHGRGAAFGATVADLLAAVGCDVHREYYVNDAGRQMAILAVSLWLRYLANCGEVISFPSNGYQGDYLVLIAQALYAQHGKFFHKSSKAVFTDIPPDSEENKEIHIDALIEKAKKLIGENHFQKILDFGLTRILEDIREDLNAFGVSYETWFSEQSLWREGLAEAAIEKVIEKGYTYEKEGALWFRTTMFDDDKDRVVKRENGQYTYFASDIAYHASKYDRGFNEVIDVLGADHHGYIPRLKAIIQALDYPLNQFHAAIVQFATLYRGKERVPMSTRAGSFVTLRELREEVGKDAARFFYIMRKADQHMDFDLALAKAQSNDNPVYYIQYAHARISSVFRQIKEKKMTWAPEVGLKALSRLETAHERTLLLVLSRYSEIVLQAAMQLAPHLLAHYLRELADAFHSYYNAFPFLVSDDTLRHARLCLIDATRQILANGLGLLGVSAPEAM